MFSKNDVIYDVFVYFNIRVHSFIGKNDFGNFDSLA